jgi:hypothetical protein
MYTSQNKTFKKTVLGHSYRQTQHMHKPLPHATLHMTAIATFLAHDSSSRAFINGPSINGTTPSSSSEKHTLT